MNLWKSLKEWTGPSSSSNQKSKMSRYSLVATDDLKSESQLWKQLPEEVKCDLLLQPIREDFENEHESAAKLQLPKKIEESHNLQTSVDPSPILQSLQVITEELIEEVKDEDKKEREKDVTIVNTPTNNRQTKFLPPYKTRYIVKMVTLLASWLFFVVMFLMYDEQTKVLLGSSVVFDNVKRLTLKTSKSDTTIRLELSGPFLSELEEMMMNSSELTMKHQIQVWMNRFDNERNEIIQSSTLYLQDQDLIDLSIGKPRSITFNLRPPDLNQSCTIFINTTSKRLIPFTLSYSTTSLDDATGASYAVLLLIGLYMLFIFEIINRTMSIILMSTMSLAVLSMIGERPSFSEIISWLDVESLLLIFSMMLLTAITAETGVFDVLAVSVYGVTKGNFRPLVFLLCCITTALSTFLENVATVLLMSPIIIRVSEVMDLDPVPILMIMSIFSNIGGAATAIGGPNAVVASDGDVIQAGINTTNLTAHMTLGVLLVFMQASMQIRYMFRDTNKVRPKVSRNIQEIHNQISIFRRAADSLTHLTKEVHMVRERIERKIAKLTSQLEVLARERNNRHTPKGSYENTLLELNNEYKMKDKVLLAKATFAMCFVALFSLHTVYGLNRVSVSWAALLAVILLLILTNRDDLEPLLRRVEWSTLLYLAAFSVFIEVISRLQLIKFAGDVMEKLILKMDDSARLAFAILVIQWISGVMSALIDNIPLTTLMTKVVMTIGSNPHLHLPLAPLMWSMLFGICLGGNGFLTGSSAHVVCAGVAEQHGYKVGFARFFKLGCPVMIGHLVVTSGYLILCHCILSW